MKKLSAVIGTVILSAAFATAASADAIEGQVTSSTTGTGTQVDASEKMLDEPAVTYGVLAPKLINLTEKIYFYDGPNGKALGAVSSQVLLPTGAQVDDWVEIYTWLGKAWIYAPYY